MINYYLFPFGQIEHGDKVIIWGYGWVGKCFVEQIMLTEYCELVAVVDRNYKEINKCKFVSNPEIIKNYDNEKIVIAQSNGAIAYEIIQQLLLWGIDKKNIIYQKNETSIGNLKDEKIDKTLQIVNDIDYKIEKAESKVDYLKRIMTSVESDLRDVRGNIDQRLYIHLCCIKKELKTYVVLGCELTRLGNTHDGGYVMLNHFTYQNKIAYSFGISDDISWDKEMSERGIEVFMYDHTIDFPMNLNENMHFSKTGLCGSDKKNNENLKTIEELIYKNNHEHEDRMILKVDIEGDEYDFLRNVNENILKKFDQIVMEMHFVTDCDLTETIVNAFRKLNKTHYLVHIHGNNYSHIRYVNNDAISDSIEVLYVNKDLYEFETSKENVIIPDDRPNDNDRMEVCIK